MMGKLKCQQQKIKTTHTQMYVETAPKERMEGGDQIDDIDINEPETRKKHLEGIKQQEKKSTLKK